MVSAAAHSMLALAIAFGPAAPPPSARPFDCSWLYRPPTGPRERFEGVYFSFIDNGGFVACASDATCRDWMGKAAAEIAFSGRASARLRKRFPGIYGVYRIAFEGRRGRLGTRPGCEDDGWTLDSGKADYVRVERVLSVRRLAETLP